MTAAGGFDADYRLEDRYARERGRVYLTGVQALVRLPLMQRRRDLAAGLSTAGFISGYRGSPLGTYDLALWQAQGRARRPPRPLRARRERGPRGHRGLGLAAGGPLRQADATTASSASGTGRGPGVDRSCDALKHGNYAGAARERRRAGARRRRPGRQVLLDRAPERAGAVHCGIPILNPAERAGVSRLRPARLRALALLGQLGRDEVSDRHGRQRALGRGRSRSACTS